jgi:hypothetical protein
MSESVRGMSLGYHTLSEKELQTVLSGEGSILLRGEVPGFAAYYGCYVHSSGDKLQRVITWLQLTEIDRVGTKKILDEL